MAAATVETEKGGRRPGPVAALPATIAVDLRPEHRIVQADGRRYSIKLEAGFWDALKTIAAGRRLRVNRLVAVLASEEMSVANLASRLRVFCLAELRRRLTDAAFATDRTSLLALAESAPAPCMVLGPDQRIVSVNLAFSSWFGAGSEALAGSPVLRHFRFRSRLSFDELWEAFADRAASEEDARIINIMPGRVLSTNARLVRVAPGGRVRPMCLVWLVR